MMIASISKNMLIMEDNIDDLNRRVQVLEKRVDFTCDAMDRKYRHIDRDMEKNMEKIIDRNIIGKIDKIIENKIDKIIDNKIDRKIHRQLSERTLHTHPNVYHGYGGMGTSRVTMGHQYGDVMNKKKISTLAA